MSEFWPVGPVSTFRRDGYLDTDYAAKGLYALDAIEKYDIVCVHVEAPDEASHEGRADAKVEALERIDSDIVGPIRKALEAYPEWRILIAPDHSTLLRTRPMAVAGRVGDGRNGPSRVGETLRRAIGQRRARSIFSTRATA